jgi:hypothetical protein
VEEIAMVCLRVAASFTFASFATLMTDGVAAEPRAVIELFTSQGCSSCPPADQLVGEYVQDRSVIAMTLAVDYWDYLGWKDTLALAGHTRRQRAYAGARGDREVYTPQAVINGAVHALGSDKGAIEKAIKKSREHAPALALEITMAVADDKVTVSVPAAKDDKSQAQIPSQAEVWLCPITRTVPVAIGRGENNGRTITYSNVVRRWIKLGEWTGKAETFSIPLKDVQNGTIDSAAVVVQSGVASAPKFMLGAAQIALR